MLYAVPTLQADDERVLEDIDRMRESLRYQVATPHRWTGQLRRQLVAHGIKGSNSIEGYQVSVDDAVAAAGGDEPLDTAPEVWAEITGYRDALTFVQQLANAAEFRFGYMLLNSLHFMMLKHHPERWPGRFRPSGIWITDHSTGEVVYTGPDAGDLAPLMGELADWLQDGDLAAPLFVRAAVAHLNLVRIHPWRDGNGRMSRCLHTLVLARDAVLAPEFSSIEEWLGTGRNTFDYYDALRETGGERWQPHADTLPWVRFCLRAHHMQMQRVQQRLDRAARLWETLEGLGLPARTTSALYAAASGGRVRRTTYQRDEQLTADQATRDLRMLLEHGLLEQRGQTRGRHYVGASSLMRISEALGRPEPLADPYDRSTRRTASR
ncbi:Fic family protein [Dactylosporangium sucinum]|uniref:Cell division protein Fic n=1 Tax=Dactylosporangium sucinum TaxID=1424081 RepID=A0A917TBW9_9ACTN|nr:Fic family protein [Dactylosporangium sucinum]GGM17128.1 cell division protein Fic [Dactylosporangium sucinum]